MPHRPARILAAGHRTAAQRRSGSASGSTGAPAGSKGCCSSSRGNGRSGRGISTPWRSRLSHCDAPGEAEPRGGPRAQGIPTACGNASGESSRGAKACCCRPCAGGRCCTSSSIGSQWGAESFQPPSEATGATSPGYAASCRSHRSFLEASSQPADARVVCGGARHHAGARRGSGDRP